LIQVPDIGTSAKTRTIQGDPFMKKIIVMGGAGFIGSAFVWKLNLEEIDDILVVDDLGNGEKWKNPAGLRHSDYLHKDVSLRSVTAHSLEYAPQHHEGLEASY
jgi:ADP-L-glycero-D-manno-heptose 6-epimerase